jgi:hypothetical protein
MTVLTQDLLVTADEHLHAIAQELKYRNEARGSSSNFEWIVGNLESGSHIRSATLFVA